MNQPYNPFFVPNPQQEAIESEKRNLRRDASYIGVLSIVLTLVMSFFFSILASILIAAGVIAPDDLTDPFLGLGNTNYLFLYMAVYTFDLLAPAVVVSFLYKKRFCPFAPSKPVSFSFAFFGIITAVGLCMLANIINSFALSFFMEMGLEIPEPPQMMEATPLSLILNLFTMAVLPALLEEMIYRGYILRTLRPYGNMFAVIVSSLLFSLMHGNLRQIPFAFVVGLVLGLLYVISDNIWLPIAVHFANNAISVSMEYLGYFLPEDRVDLFYTVIIYGLILVGIVTAIVLLLRHKEQLKIRKIDTQLTVAQRTSALINTPLFIVAIVLYLLLLFLGS